MTSVNDILNLCVSSLEDSVDDNIPTKTARKKDVCPWITTDLTKTIKRMDRAFKKKKNQVIKVTLLHIKTIRAKPQKNYEMEGVSKTSFNLVVSRI